jgi:hypothetical protein
MNIAIISTSPATWSWPDRLGTQWCLIDQPLGAVNVCNSPDIGRQGGTLSKDSIATRQDWLNAHLYPVHGPQLRTPVPRGVSRTGYRIGSMPLLCHRVTIRGPSSDDQSTCRPRIIPCGSSPPSQILCVRIEESHVDYPSEHANRFSSRCVHSLPRR